jgi:hypothetical protein
MKYRGVLTQGGARSSLTLGYNHITPTGLQFASLQHDPNRPEDVLKVDADEDGVGGGMMLRIVCVISSRRRVGWWRRES